jgi:prepilin-type N-terminal cleavage/methylation domain-containing protein
MIFRRLGLINKKQEGFTLIEMIIALTLAAIIVTAVTMVTFQVINGSARSNNHMTAIREVQNAGYWVSRDFSMAQTWDDVDNPVTPALEIFTLEWTEQLVGNKTHTIVYTLVGNELRRSYAVDDAEPTELTVAEFIDSCEFQDLTFQVTATVGDGPLLGTETREYKVIPRPN